MNYRIEYNRKQNMLHLEHVWHGMKKANTYGWETVAEDVPDPLATSFCAVLIKMFNLNDGDYPIGDRITTTILRHEFAVFICYLSELEQRGFIMVDVPKNYKLS